MVDNKHRKSTSSTTTEWHRGKELSFQHLPFQKIARSTQLARRATRTGSNRCNCWPAVTDLAAKSVDLAAPFWKGRALRRRLPAPTSIGGRGSLHVGHFASRMCWAAFRVLRASFAGNCGDSDLWLKSIHTFCGDLRRFAENA